MKESQRASKDESQLRVIEKAFKKRGVMVRREKLSRGPAFKVKSGDCLLAGEKLIFVDRRLPSDQQLAVLLEYLIDGEFHLSADEIKNLSPSTQKLLQPKHSVST